MTRAQLAVDIYESELGTDKDNWHASAGGDSIDVSSQVQQASNSINDVLDAYKGMQRLEIRVNGKIRAIWMDNENLRVDSSGWEVTEIGGTRVKINPQKDIIEYLDGYGIGQQLFSIDSAQREARKIGKRLPFVDSSNPEFQGIIEQVGVSEFMKNACGFWEKDGGNFGTNKFRSAYILVEPLSHDYAYFMNLDKLDGNTVVYAHRVTHGLVRLVKDIASKS